MECGLDKLISAQVTMTKETSAHHVGQGGKAEGDADDAGSANAVQEMSLGDVARLKMVREKRFTNKP